MIVVGINSHFEHPAVVLLEDDVVRFAVEDERFTGIKHGRKYSPYRTYVPFDALYATLRDCSLVARDIDEIAYSYHRWDHLRGLWGCFTGRRFSSFQEEVAAFISVSNVRKALGSGYEILEKYRSVLDPAALGRIEFREWNHHLSHAASSFYCSGYDEALVVVCDGAGEREATSVYIGRAGRLRRIAVHGLPHSLGILYSMVTRHLGFELFSDEFKVMGLAAYGEPRHAQAFRRLVATTPGGGYLVDVRSLKDLRALLGVPRATGASLDQSHKDIARSLQDRLEEVLEHIVVHHLGATGLRRLCLAGGTFMNCVANGRLGRLPTIDELFVQPAAHDAGTALGAAVLSSIRRGGPTRLKFGSVGLGTEHGDAEIERILVAAGTRHRRLSDEELIEELATRLAGNQVAGLFRGRMEFGPRALGMRSILASPMDSRMRDRLNLLKGREGFRPVAPIVTAEAFERFFSGRRNRYMVSTSLVRDPARPLIPAVVHADGTARAQTVWEADDAFLHAVLVRFGALTGIPVLINTSLNVRGKPIVESPEDALACLHTTGMDFLVCGHFLAEKAPTAIAGSGGIGGWA